MTLVWTTIVAKLSINFPGELVRGFGGGDGLLRAGLEVSNFDDEFARRVAFQSGGVGRLDFLGAFELFVGLGRGQGIVHGATGIAQIVDELERRRAEGFVLDENEDVDGGVEFWEQGAGLEQFEEDDVAEAEAERGEIHLAAADELDEVIVATAAGDGAEFALLIEGLEHDAGVISEAADDVVIHFDKVLEPTGGKILEDGFQFRGRSSGVNEGIDFIEGEAEFGEFLGALSGLLTLEFVDNLIKFVRFGGVGTTPV